MIPNAQLRLVSSSPISASAEFGISMNDAAHIMSILRAQMYSDKILAVLREYAANAWDAHRDSGQSERPINITLPTAMDPTLSIRDFGKGLSEEEVFTVFTQYGASTKRTNDNTVGMLGIGSKSGFAYSDSFTITSFNGGMKSTYVAVLDASEKGLINLLHREPWDGETGLEISIAARPEDLREFEKKAKHLYKYFIPRPTINITLPKLPAAQAQSKHGVIYTKDGFETDDDDSETYYVSSKWVAIMGCVSYNINLSQVRDVDSTDAGGVADFLSNISGALFFDIGAVQVSASREELNYSPETKLALVKKFNDLVEEYVRQTLDTILGGTFSPWERRVRAQVLSQLKLPVPANHKGLVEGHVGIKEKKPSSFGVYQNKMGVTSLRIRKHTRLILEDDRRARAGYDGLTGDDYFVRIEQPADPKFKKNTWDSVTIDLEKMCLELEITGIPILKLSSLPWKTPTRVGGRTINPKHRMKVFTFQPGQGYSKPWSDAWDAEERVPDPSDVFVLINGFKTQGFDIGEYYRRDQQLVKEFGGTLPKIYGYKTTEKKPVEEENCVGTPYTAWRRTMAAALVTPDIIKEVELLRWLDAIQRSHRYWRDDHETSMRKHAAVLEKELGVGHSITVAVKNHSDSIAYFKKFQNRRDALSILIERVPELIPAVDAASATIASIYSTYPLLTIEDVSISDLWGNKSEAWLQYIKLVDKP